MSDGVPFSEFMDGALYDPATGFYAVEGRAGRRGDFLTSPEVGPLFGALMAERLDREWDLLGRPDPFVVVDAGAGPGTLARAVALASPRCAPAVRYVLMEVTASQRRRHAEHLDGWVGEVDAGGLARFVTAAGSGPRFASSAVLPVEVDGVIVANELLDNLPFDIVRRTPGGAEMLTVVDGGPTTGSIPVELPEEVAALLARAPVGTWMPWQHRARQWVADALASLRRGTVIVLDYGDTTDALAVRPATGWLRTYAAHERGADPFSAPGSRDITCDVDIDQLALDQSPDLVTTQGEWLEGLGIDALVAEGRRLWHERATAPDLVALRGRSRVREAEALCDRSGLGAHLVLEWHRRPPWSAEEADR
jgi:SAM-dependent MidA family methyltransferase